MRTLLFSIFIVGLIAGGLYWKNKGGFFSKPEGFDDKIFEKEKDDIIEPSSKWQNLLPGNWKLIIKEETGSKFWLTIGEIQLYENKNVIINVTANYYDGNQKLVGLGGGISGKWIYAKDLGFQLDSTKCDFRQSYLAPKATWEGNANDHCNLLCNIKYGIVNDGSDVKTDIQVFSRHKLLVTGKRYSDEGKVFYLLTR